MNSLVIWENNTLSIRYFNKKYSLYDGDKLVVNDYDSLTPCIDSLFIAVMRENYSYKYQLLNINGEKVFGDEKKFEFIGFNHELNKFTFYDYFNKIDLVFPKLSEEKNKLFILFLRQIYRKKINDICEFQTIVDEICKKMDNLSNEDILKIIENLDLTNKLYIRLNKPSYLKNHLIILDEEEEKELLKIIDNYKFIIFKELTKDIIKNPKIYELNEGIINNIISNEKITCLNQVLNSLNNIRDKFIAQIKYYSNSRYEIFSSLDSIKSYFLNNETIKYFDERDFNYIKSNKNIYFNVMFNKKNEDILDLLRKYDIS